jgi:thiamine biosynthesis lipoprotein ApbE
MVSKYGSQPHRFIFTEDRGKTSCLSNKKNKYLELAIDAYTDTHGAVNIALGPVLSIWHDYREKAEAGAAVPSYDELNAASAHMLPGDIEIDRENSTVHNNRENGLSRKRTGMTSLLIYSDIKLFLFFIACA